MEMPAARPAGRLLVRKLGNEAVVLDLATGAFYRVAGSGVAIADALARGETPGAIADRLVREVGIDPARARADVESVALALAADEAPATRSDPGFAPAWDGLDLRWAGRPVLRVDGPGRGATLLGEPGAPPTPGERLRWALPHLLWLSGGAVLHASAVRVGGAVLALTGASGSGKSTLARLLSGGTDPVSDDLLVLRAGPTELEAVLGGEAAARNWEAREAPRLAGGREARLLDEDVAALTAGPALPLAAIWLLDAARRDADEIALESSAGAAGLGLLLEQSFAETGVPEVWQRIFEATASIVEMVPIFRATVPGTLAKLGAAARRYRAMVAS